MRIYNILIISFIKPYVRFGCVSPIYIENSNSTTPLIYGDFLNDFVTVHGSLNVTNFIVLDGASADAGETFIDATGVLQSSDKRLKTNIKTLENASQISDKLRGISYQWKESGQFDMGEIAQEV